jgi:hypothetical protein
MAQIIAAIGGDVACRFISLNDVSAPASASRRSALEIIARAETSDEQILSFNASAQFSPADTDSMKAIFGDKFKTFTNIRFDGLHPDCTYFGRFGGRQLASMGEYHSKLILYAYATGRSQQDCLTLFNGCNYERLGYFEIWNISAQLLLERDEACDIKFASTFLEICRQDYPLYSFNHPTSAVFHELAITLCRALDIPVRTIGRHHFPNPLFQNFIWPIYPEVVEHFALPYKGNMAFYMPAQGESDRFFSRSRTLEEIVKADYDHYAASMPKAEFLIALQTLDFFDRFQDELG